MDQVTCKICGAKCNSEDELMKHNAEAHPASQDKAEGEMKCAECGMPFTSKDDLDAHAKEAHGKV